MIYYEPLPWAIRRRLTIFLAIYFFTLMAGEAALFSITQVIPLSRDKVGLMYFVGLGLAFFTVCLVFFVSRAHPRALKSLIVLLVVCFLCASFIYKTSPKPVLTLMVLLPSLIALWLLNTRRFRGLWKRLCVMRRRRTRQRRLIRQLKRMRRR